MGRLLSSLAQIALLRRDPGILPSSFLFVALMALAYAGASALHVVANGGDRLLARVALDVGLTLAFFWLLLVLMRRGHRYPQTISAVLGTYVLLAPLVGLLLLLRDPIRTNHAVWLVTTVGTILVVVWYLLIVAHILRSALDTGIVTGYAIAVAWVLGSRELATHLFAAA
jgi:hypothetical protein